MIAPRSRLLAVTGLLLVPCAAVATAAPTLAGPALILLLLGVLIFLVDAIRAVEFQARKKSLFGVDIQLPQTVRLTQHKEGTLDLEIRPGAGGPKRLRIGFSFPLELRSPYEDREINMLRQEDDVLLSWPCTGVKRGRFTTDHVYLEASSPWGFWNVRRVVSAPCEFRVYPNLMRERKNLAAMFLNRGGLGVHAQRQVGRGRDFEKLREYIPGDSFEDIHWKATAKRGKPVTRLYQIERTQEVYVLVDASRLSAQEAELGEDGKPVSILERFITSSLIMAMAAERQGDLFGLMTFSDKMHTFIRAKTGKEHFNVCRDAIYTLDSNLVTPDFEDICSVIRQRLRKRALLVFLTNLNDPRLAESFIHSMDLIGHHHLVLANMITPPDVQPLFSNDQVETSSDIYKALSGHLQWSDLRETAKVLKHKGVQFNQVPNESLSLDLVRQYVNVKNRQIL